MKALAVVGWRWAVGNTSEASSASVVYWEEKEAKEYGQNNAEQPDQRRCGPASHAQRCMGSGVGLRVFQEYQNPGSPELDVRRGGPHSSARLLKEGLIVF